MRMIDFQYCRKYQLGVVTTLDRLLNEMIMYTNNNRIKEILLSGRDLIIAKAPLRRNPKKKPKI